MSDSLDVLPIKRKQMKNLIKIRESSRMLFRQELDKRRQSAGIQSIAFISLIAFMVLLASCKKDEDTPAEEMILAPTGARLVHSSYHSDDASVDLYVDDVKVNGSGSISFFSSSAYYPLSAGSRRFAVKTSAGVSLADTTLTIGEGKQYSFFIKDRQYLDENTLQTVPLKSGLIPVINNNTSAPADGKAKVRFVNMSSMPLNDLQSHITFSRVNTAPASVVVITQALGQDKLTFASDYSSFDAGPITFRASSINQYAADLITNLEAGKLYTLYVVSTEFLVRTPTKSPIALKMIANN